MYNNIFDDAALTESSEADGFPAENIQNPFRTKVWRTEGLVAGTANLVIDHGAAKAVNAIAITGHNWSSAPATLDVEFNTIDNWVAPAATESLTWADYETANGNLATIIKKLDTTRTYRYNRLNVVYAPGDFDIGKIFLGEYFEPTIEQTIGIMQDFEDKSRIMSTIGGQDHVDEIEMYRTIKFKMIARTQVQWELFQKMLRAVGKRKDLFIAFDYTNEPNELTIYGKFDRLPSMKQTVVSLFEMNFRFKESR